MAIIPWRNRFWWRWIAANSFAELVGLGGIAAVGFLIISRFGEPHGPWQSLAFAAVFVLLGAFEGLVVGLAQQRVLLQRLPQMKGWVQATVVGAVVAWAMGMVPSTIMNMAESETSGAPPEISKSLQLLFAAGMGLVAGPILAFFQWRRLRRYVAHAGWWLPANAAAWALGMPVVFVGAHMTAITSSPVFVALGVAVVLMTAGAVVGAVHGRVLVWLLSSVDEKKDFQRRGR